VDRLESNNPSEPPVKGLINRTHATDAKYVDHLVTFSQNSSRRGLSSPSSVREFLEVVRWYDPKSWSHRNLRPARTCFLSHRVSGFLGWSDSVTRIMVASESPPAPHFEQACAPGGLGCPHWEQAPLLVRVSHRRKPEIK
jgi:hypothetical protein